MHVKCFRVFHHPGAALFSVNVADMNLCWWSWRGAVKGQSLGPPTGQEKLLHLQVCKRDNAAETAEE